MKVSSRNQFQGVVSAVTVGPVHTEVAIDLAGGDKLVAVVTSASTQSLGVAAGKRAMALVKAPLVTLLTDAGGYHFSARNQLEGKVTAVQKGAVNSEVTLRLNGGADLHAVVTNDAVADLQLASGKAATALIKASHVILAVAD